MNDLNDPIEINDDLKQFMASTPKSQEGDDWICAKIADHPDTGICICEDFDLAMKIREMLGEDKFKYVMCDVEWGHLYKIELAGPESESESESECMSETDDE